MKHSKYAAAALVAALALSSVAVAADTASQPTTVKVRVSGRALVFSITPRGPECESGSAVTLEMRFRGRAVTRARALWCWFPGLGSVGTPEWEQLDGGGPFIVLGDGTSVDVVSDYERRARRVYEYRVSVDGNALRRGRVRVVTTPRKATRIWQGTDAFINTCINDGYRIRSLDGRLYCDVEWVARVQITILS